MHEKSIMNIKKTLTILVGVALTLTLTLTNANAANEKSRLLHPITGQAPLRTFVVTKTTDATDNATAPVGTFRRALFDANKNPGFDAIIFDIPGSGVQTITLKIYLPEISDDQGVMIDGTQGDDRIEINGSQTSGHHGFSIISNNNVVRGLTINGIKTAAAIAITRGNNNVISGNFLGTNPAGTSRKANHSGILLHDSDHNIIGGTNGVSPGGACTGDCNLLSGNDFNGVVLDAASSDNRIIGNFIGVNANGTAAIPNNEDGVLIAKSDHNFIGGPTAQERNVISGNLVSGVELGLDGAHHNLIRGNWIGTNSAGNRVIGGKTGIDLMTFAHDNVIDGNVIVGQTDFGVFLFRDAVRTEIKNNRIGISPFDDSNMGNVIRAIEIQTDGNFVHHNRIGHNAKGGIRVKSGQRNRFSQNEIFENGTLGINLGTDAFTPNDNGDGDGGPNGLQNFPTIGSASYTGVLTINGTLNSRPNARYTVELFYSPTCGNAFGIPVGEGKTYLASASVSTDGSGNGGFSLPTSQNLSAGFVTGTATDSDGNTSEFSYCKAIAGGMIPEKPSLLLPNNNKTIEQNPPLLRWKPAANTTFYKVTLRTGSPSGPVFHKKGGIVGTEYRTPTLPSGQTFYWRVFACNLVAPSCTKSSWFNFRVP